MRRRALACALLSIAIAGAAPADEHGRLVSAIGAFGADEATVRTFHRLDGPERFDAEAAVLDRWTGELAAFDVAALGLDGRIDRVLFERLLARRRFDLERRRTEYAAALALAPFHETVLAIERIDRLGEAFACRDLASRLGVVPGALAELRADAEALGQGAVRVRGALALAQADNEFLADWYGQHADGDPLFGWWLERPVAAAREALGAYARHLEGSVLPDLKTKENAFAIGPEALAAALRFEFCVESPEQVLAIGQREYYATEQELIRTAGLIREGADWKEVLEEVKADQVEVGGERRHVHEEATGAIRFVEDEGLFEIPLLARKWSLVRIGAEAQKTYPFAYYSNHRMGFAFALRSQDHQAKEAALRGNNRHFTRTVVPHELVPGHHLQAFYAARHRTHRQAFRSPVLVEGWGYYCERLLDEHGYFVGPRARLGHLYWRLVRAARILVSFEYHLGRMTHPEMVDFLVTRVGLDAAGAAAEVDRYMTYSPLYQASYTIGALQLLALRDEIRERDGDDFSYPAFHEAVLRQNAIPVGLIRKALLDLPVEDD